MKKSSFHPHITEVKNYLKDTRDERYETIKKLTEPEESYLDIYTKMWKTIENHSDTSYDSLWVNCFIDSAFRALSLPEYFYIKEVDRKELVKKINRLTTDLNKLYKAYDLECNFVHINGKIFNGFYLYENFGETNQGRMTNDGINKLASSDALKAVSDYALERINEAAKRGKSGKNVKAIRFIRILSESNKMRFNKPLNFVLATAAHAFFDIEYSESDISNILNR